MEPTQAEIMDPEVEVVYTIKTSVTGISKKAGWFVSLKGLWTSLYIGQERPDIEVGDEAIIQIRRPHAKHSGTSIEQSSEAPTSR